MRHTPDDDGSGVGDGDGEGDAEALGLGSGPLEEMVGVGELDGGGSGGADEVGSDGDELPDGVAEGEGWPGVGLPGAGPSAPVVAAGRDACPCRCARPAPWKTSDGSGPAAAGGRTVSVTNDIRTNTIAADTSRISGGSRRMGWPRMAAAPLRTVMRSRSSATANAMLMAGNRGPWPTRPLLRTLESAAWRWSAVRPGNR